MPSTIATKRSAEELKRVAEEFLQSRAFGPEENGNFIAIAVDDADFEIHANDVIAVSRVSERHPGADIWLSRIGYQTAYQMGTAA